MKRVILALVILAGCSKPPEKPATPQIPPVIPKTTPETVIVTNVPQAANLPVAPEIPAVPLVVAPVDPDGRISGDGRQLIYEFEVGGGKPYYDKKLSRPTVPPAASGVTVGIGFDCGYNTATQIVRAWDRLPDGQARRLSTAAGLIRDRARAILPTLRDIQIEWGDAEAVFNETTLTDFLDIADNAFPAMDALHPNAQAVLVSIAFNRGGSMKGESRKEMRELRDLVPKADYRGMAAAIRKMKRLWPDVPGLIRRREAEAKMMESCE